MSDWGVEQLEHEWAKIIKGKAESGLIERTSACAKGHAK